MCVARYARITKNNKFAICLQHVQKEVSDAVDFYMQISMKASYKLTNIPKFPKEASMQFLYNIPKKFRDEVDFFDVDKHQSFPTVDFNTLSIKGFYNVIG